MKKTRLKLLSVLLSVLIVMTCTVILAGPASATSDADDETVTDEVVTDTDAETALETDAETEEVTEEAAEAADPHDAPASTGASGTTIYCQNDAGWSSINCYMWNSDSDKNASWPGVKMTDLGDGVWQYEAKKSFKNVIFNTGSTQTGDLSVPSEKNCYNNSTGEWDYYSPSPVKISSLTTDLESPAYTGCAIRITAVAKSDQGKLTYKFSVKDSKGSSAVLSNGAASSVSWVPSVADKYTITVDISDTAGNSNTRSIPFEIGNSATLESPFIRAFRNSLGTTTQIKQNTTMTFTTDAIGGKIGTNLLFYKFSITDPSGKENVAYYTTKNTYSYKPTALGQYTFRAYVQNSYNDTVVKELNFECVSTINEQETDPGPTGPTETDPTPGQYKLGDVNHDNSVNIKDATLIQKHLASLPVDYIDLSLSVCDTDKDKRITVKDCTRIQMLIAFLITSF